MNECDICGIACVAVCSDVWLLSWWLIRFELDGILNRLPFLGAR